LASLKCSSNTKHAYYKGTKVFVRWLFKTKRIKEDPLILIDSPKETKAILPSLTREQVEYLIAQADNLRDKTIIALLSDSGMRLKEIGNIKVSDIDWESMTITIWDKGNKQRRAPFTARSGDLLMQYLSDAGSDSNGYGNIWKLKPRSIQCMLGRLSKKTGITSSTHEFRRGFASDLHRAGLDVEHIMRLGGWESLDMVRDTRGR
jgi:site-specific recombinase XerD